MALARRFDPARAFVLAVLGGFLFLPELTEIDLPLLPALTKHSVPILSVLLFWPLFRPPGPTGITGPARSLLAGSPVMVLATLGLALGALATVVANGDRLFYGPTVLPGMRLYDGLSQILSTLILVLPMLLARRFLARPEDHLLLLRLLCFAALGYSLLALFEVRMSPQLNNWTYGFFPHSWIQHYRGGGWRPIVFMIHGLVLSIFFCMAILAAAGLFRIERDRRRMFLLACLWLILTLVLSKSLGALLIMLMILPVVLFLGVRGQLIGACLIAGLMLSYPVARSAGVIPIDWILKTAHDFDPARAQSFEFRVVNEERMLAKAEERPILGWGGWGRSRVFDPVTGADISTADGEWIIVLGVGGWVRYILEFGLLCLPLVFLLRNQKRYGIGMESSVLALMLSANILDLLPNSSITPITWLVAGALWGRLELGRIEAPAQGAETGAAGPARSGYRRVLKPAPAAPEPVAASAPAQAGTKSPATPYTRQKARHRRKSSNH